MAIQTRVPLDQSRSGCPDTGDRMHAIEWADVPAQTSVLDPEHNVPAHRRGWCIACGQDFRERWQDVVAKMPNDKLDALLESDDTPEFLRELAMDEVDRREFDADDPSTATYRLAHGESE